MAGLQIIDETVFVIYKDGKPYEATGRKLVYTKKGAANGVITAVAGDEAQRRHNDKRRGKEYTIPEWYYLGRDENKRLIDEVRKEFEVVEYGPKRLE